MNGTPTKIQIIAPFSAAFEWMKTMLFSPFDLAKYLTIAFAAFLAGNWGHSFRFGRSWNIPDWNYRFTRHTDLGTTDWDIGPWLIAAFVGIGLFVMVLAVVWMWVSCRGRFIFTDCVAKNRGAIAEPWNEFRREGNSLFLFSLAVAFGALVLVGIIGGLLWFVFFGTHGDESGVGGVLVVIVLIVVGMIWLALSLFFALVTTFMVPVMYRRRCRAMDAFRDVSKLVFANPGPFILFVLFGIALLIALAVAGTIIACMTCCIGGLPYISTVILLPAIVCLAAYKLLFIRQFGDQYDVWATIVAPPPTTEPLPPPASSV
jgi:hypothetical protein